MKYTEKDVEALIALAVAATQKYWRGKLEVAEGLLRRAQWYVTADKDRANGAVLSGEIETYLVALNDKPAEGTEGKG